MQWLCRAFIFGCVRPFVRLLNATWCYVETNKLVGKQTLAQWRIQGEDEGMHPPTSM